MITVYLLFFSVVFHHFIQRKKVILTQVFQKTWETFQRPDCELCGHIASDREGNNSENTEAVVGEIA